MKSNNETDFIIVFKGFDLCENDSSINNLGIAPKLRERVPLGPKMGPSFLRFHIHKYSKYTKFRNSFVINCCLVFLWKLPTCSKLTFLNKSQFFLKLKVGQNIRKGVEYQFGVYFSFQTPVRFLVPLPPPPSPSAFHTRAHYSAIMFPIQNFNNEIWYEISR